MDTETPRKSRNSRTVPIAPAMWRPAEYGSWSKYKQKVWNTIPQDPDAFYLRYSYPEQHSSGEWSIEEIALLREFLLDRPAQDMWGLFSINIPSRNGTQCRDMAARIEQQQRVLDIDRRKFGNNSSDNVIVGDLAVSGEKPNVVVDCVPVKSAETAPKCSMDARVIRDCKTSPVVQDPELSEKKSEQPNHPPECQLKRKSSTSDISNVSSKNIAKKAKTTKLLVKTSTCTTWKPAKPAPSSEIIELFYPTTQDDFSKHMRLIMHCESVMLKLEAKFSKERDCLHRYYITALNTLIRNGDASKVAMEQLSKVFTTQMVLF